MSRFHFFKSITVPLQFVFLMWAVFFIGLTYNYNLAEFGIVPRTSQGILGILFAPLIHGNIVHLFSNTIPLLFIGTLLFYFYGTMGKVIFFKSYFWTNTIVWLVARPANHIGASGVVYGLAFFLIFFGIFRRDFLSLAVSLLTAFTYGSIFYGVLPIDPLISWESHIAGALVGTYTAIDLRNKKIK